MCLFERFVEFGNVFQIFEEINNKSAKSAPKMTVYHKQNILGHLPGHHSARHFCNGANWHIVNKENVDENVEFKFRVRTPMENKKIVVKLNDQVIKSVVKLHLLPAEMENVIIKKYEFNSDSGKLVIEVEDR